MALLKFSTLTLFLSAFVSVAVLGGAWPWLILALAIAAMTLADELIGDWHGGAKDWAAPLFNAFLYASLPFLAVLSMLLLTFVSSGDPFALIAASNRFLGFDLAAAREATTTLDLLGMTLTLGFMYGAAAVNVGHELVHRVNRPFDLMIGRWLLAFASDTTFGIEHVYGHHKHVGTFSDPATARRGEYVLFFLFRSGWGQFRNAFLIEAARLRNEGRGPWTWHNRAIRGQLMSLFLAAVFYYAAGWMGLAIFVALGAMSKVFLESINYIEHYGLVRAPGNRVETKHSWDSYKFCSSGVLYNLPFHSEHHKNAAKRYWQIGTNTTAPELPHGYLTMVIVAWIFPVWKRLIHPRLRYWDEHRASPEELQLIKDYGWSLR